MNADHVLETLCVFCEGGVTEIRAITAGRTFFGYFDDYDLAVRAVQNLENNPKVTGIYFVFNEINPDLLARSANRVKAATRDGTTGDQHILRRRWLLIDVDSGQAAGISASREEKLASVEVATQVRCYLESQGWPDPIRADSGNGFHLLYGIDEPPDDGGLVQKCLQALAEMFDVGRIKIDTSVFNPARISKLYGTTARKGDSTTSRPHRLSRLCHVPPEDELFWAEHELLVALAAKATAAESPRRTFDGSHYRSQIFDVREFLQRNFIEFRETDFVGKIGIGTKFVLAECPWNSDHRDPDSFVIQFQSGSISAKCSHNSCSWDWRELRERFEPAAERSANYSNGNGNGNGRHHPSALTCQEAIEYGLAPEAVIGNGSAGNGASGNGAAGNGAAGNGAAGSSGPNRDEVVVADVLRDLIEGWSDEGNDLVSTGIQSVDNAIGGGLAPGELVLIAARPSHGKSMLALQLLHERTAQGSPVLFVSEEMSVRALALRMMQYLTDMPQEQWERNSAQLREELENYLCGRSDAWLRCNVRTAERLDATVRQAIAEHHVQMVIVDYVQLLADSGGKSRYEQVTNVSISLRQIASQHNIIVVGLAQLNREIEGRTHFVPKPSDLKESGQLEQDCDVCLALVWPHRIDATRHRDLFEIHVLKNKNRATRYEKVEMTFEPHRQRLIERNGNGNGHYGGNGHAGGGGGWQSGNGHARRGPDDEDGPFDQYDTPLDLPFD